MRTCLSFVPGTVVVITLLAFSAGMANKAPGATCGFVPEYNPPGAFSVPESLPVAGQTYCLLPPL